MSWFIDIQEVIRKHVAEHVKEPFVKASHRKSPSRKPIECRWSPRRARPPFGARAHRRLITLVVAQTAGVSDRSLQDAMKLASLMQKSYFMGRKAHKILYLEWDSRGQREDPCKHTLQGIPTMHGAVGLHPCFLLCIKSLYRFQNYSAGHSLDQIHCITSHHTTSHGKHDMILPYNTLRSIAVCNSQPNETVHNRTTLDCTTYRTRTQYDIA